MKKQMLINKDDNLSPEQKKKRNKNLKKMVIAMLVLDLVGVFNLILQIYLKDVSYSSFITLIICNIIVFGTYKLTKDR